jgi:hypothetical protein
MKKITLLFLLGLSFIGFGQNLIQDPTFNTQTGLINASSTPWVGYSSQVLGSGHAQDPLVGNLNNGDAAMRQIFSVTENITYQVSFDYRWVSGTGNYTMTVVFKDESGALGNLTLSDASTGYVVSTTPDVWHEALFTLTIPAGVTSARLQFYKATGNRPFRFDNVSVRKIHTFDGTTNSDWSTADNWDTNEVPNDDDVTIPSGQNVVISSTSSITAGNLSIDGAGSLTINGGGSLVIPVEANVSGNITYNRTLQADQWHLVSSPLEGETYDDIWISNNGIDLGTGSNRGISTYQNGTADGTTGQWVYAQATVGGTFDTSKGYSLRRGTTGTVSFTGTYPMGAKPFAASIGDNIFNLVGNPYPTYLTLSNFFTNNPFGTKLSESTVWLWNQDTGTYVSKTSDLDGAFQIAPGQAFFVSSGNGTDIIFYQFNGVSGSETFLKQERTQVNLHIASNNTMSSAEIFYLSEGTNDFDNGYDASIFSGVASSFNVYTSQLSNGAKNLGRQVLSNENLESLVVPIGIKAAAGQEITFSSEAMNLPEGIKVFLEDRQKNTITRLDEANSSYKVALAEAVDGNGRFFLHTKASGVLSTDAIALQNVSIYKTSNETLRVVGLTQGTANMKVFNVLGKQVMNSTFQSRGANDIALPKLATGMYIVQLQNNKGKINKKIILE